MNLNPQQLQAVNCLEGPLLVFAGAGSGKTRVLTSRIEALIHTGHCTPSQILAVTFTQKAAREMQGRLALAFPDGESSSMTVSTIHSLCLRILRTFPKESGLESNFGVIDQRQQLEILKKIARSKRKRAEDAFGFRASISYNKSLGYTYEDVQNDDELDKDFLNIWKEYHSYCKSNNVVDFDDLLILTQKILKENENVRNWASNKWHYLSIDEFQDTNAVQCGIIYAIANQRQNLMVVGDDDQAIYGWRGADVTNILSFQDKYPHATVVTLDTNYRSTENILNFANAVIAKNSERKEKSLISAGGTGSPVHLMASDKDEGSAKRMARAIAMQRSKAPDKSIAILYRINKLSRIIEDELRRARIPYRLIGDVSFYERSEVKGTLSYLKVAVNPADDESLLRIINTPKRGIGPQSVEGLRRVAAENNLPIMEVILNGDALLPPAVAARTQKFSNVFEGLTDLKAAAIAQNVINRCGLIDHYTRMPGPTGNADMSKKENIEELINAVEQFDSENGQGNDGLRSLRRFLATTLINDSPGNSGNRSVDLMTIHSAKGLEFDTVHIYGFNEGQLPVAGKDVNGDEERRLAYVAITRARTALICHFKTQSPSRYLTEIPSELSKTLFSGDVSKLYEKNDGETNKKKKPGTKGPRKKKEATPKQKAYAQTIAEAMGISLPNLKDFTETSEWLDRNIPRYKDGMRHARR